MQSLFLRLLQGVSKYFFIVLVAVFIDNYNPWLIAQLRQFSLASLVSYAKLRLSTKQKVYLFFFPLSHTLFPLLSLSLAQLATAVLLLAKPLKKCAVWSENLIWIPWALSPLEIIPTSCAFLLSLSLLSLSILSLLSLTLLSSIFRLISWWKILCVVTDLRDSLRAARVALP